MLRRFSLVLLCAASCKTAETPAAVTSPAPATAGGLEPAPRLPAISTVLPTFTPSAENPLTAEKADLGWKLFFDKRLSKDDSMACESCYHIALSYTSGTALDAKVGGAMNKRNTPTVLNIAFQSNFYWDGRTPTLESVSAAAWKGQLGADPAVVAKKLNEVPTYVALFQRAFGEPATADNVPKALASFFRVLTTSNAPWDRYMAGDAAALSKEAQAGWKAFSGAGCTKCHVPPLFADLDYHSVGIGEDQGRKDATKKDEDSGKFKTPTLRNIARTAPYFHDGHAKTLEEAIALMARGGNKPGTDPALEPAKLSPSELASIKVFLEALSSESSYEQAPTLP